MPELTPTATAEQSPAVVAPETSAVQATEEEFDLPRAKALIQKLRDAEKSANQRVKEFEKSQTEAKKASDVAERARLAEQGEYKQLAEAAEKRAAELEPHKARADRYEASLTKLLTEERKGLPKHVLTLLDKLDAADQLDWIAENRTVLTAPAQTPPPNINGTAGGGGQPEVDPKEREAESRRRFRI